MIRVIFKNGKEVNFDAKEVTATCNKVSGALIGIKWINANFGDVPLYLDLNEIVAVCDVKEAKSRGG